MEAQLINNSVSMEVATRVEYGQSVNFVPYQNLIVSTLSDFNNDRLTYAQMLTIATKEVELLLIAKANNPGKINVERLIPRNIRLAILNKLQKLMR
jgi:hypothetical protein